MQPSNRLLGALHRERVARAAPRCSTVRLNGGAGPTLRLRERPGKHIGSHIWPGGGILLDFLLGGGRDLLTCRGEESSEQTATPAALLALELGSGVGSLGLSLAGSTAARGACIIVTDRDTGVLKLNCDANRGTVEANGGASCLPQQLDWNAPVVPKTDRPFDLILGADILYNSSTALPLFKTLCLLIPPKNTSTKFLLCYKPRDRVAESKFFSLLRQAETPFTALPAQTTTLEPPEALALKEKGNAAFAESRFVDAEEAYTQAIGLANTFSMSSSGQPASPSALAALWSNRAAARQKMDKHGEALADALVAVTMKPRWGKAYWRAGVSAMALQQFHLAREYLSRALALTPEASPSRETIKRELDRATSHRPVGIKDGPGSLVTWGLLPSEGCRGAGGQTMKETPRVVAGLRGQHLIDVSLGAMHTVAVCSTGVYAWGNNAHGQCGIGVSATATGSSIGPDRSSQNISVPQLVPSLIGIKVNAVSCGSGHSCAIDDGGVVWSWGISNQGQLGLGADYASRSVPTPTAVLRLYSDGQRAVGISCGIAHTAVLTVSHDKVEGWDVSAPSLFAFGWNRCGQLGLGLDYATVECVHDPIMIPQSSFGGGSAVQQVACGGAHTLVVTRSGLLFSAGSGSCGQLGLGAGPPNSMLEDGDPDGDSLESKSSATTSNVLTVLSAGKKMMNEHPNVCDFRKVDVGNEQAVAFACAGEEFSCVVTRDTQDVFAFGLNNAGQCGNGETRNCTVPTRVEAMSGKMTLSLVSGKSVTQAMTENGEVWEWGGWEDDRGGILDQPTTAGDAPRAPRLFSKLKKRVRQLEIGRSHYAALLYSTSPEQSYIDHTKKKRRSYFEVERLGNRLVVPVGKKYSFALQAVDDGGEKVEAGCDQFHVRSTHASSGGISFAESVFDDNFDGTYSVSVTPSRAGIFLVEVQLHGVHVSGSPFEIAALLPAQDELDLMRQEDRAASMVMAPEKKAGDEEMAKRRLIMAQLRREEMTRRRAKEALAKEQRRRQKEKAAERRRKKQKRCGGGFVVSYKNLSFDGDDADAIQRGRRGAGGGAEAKSACAMATLLDRLLEVAKEFEAERLQDQLDHQKCKRDLEQDLKSMTRTAQYRADEITFLEQQLAEARAETEMATAALKEERENKSAEAEVGSKEERMRREIVCLRFEVARLRKRSERLTALLTGAGKENATGASDAANEIAAEVKKMAKEDAEESFVPAPSADKAKDGAPQSKATLADMSSAAFLRAVERGDTVTVKSILAPNCVCDTTYEQAITSALTRVCAAAATTSVTSAASASPSSEGGEQEESLPSELSKKRLSIAKRLIAEGAATTAVTPTAPSALHLASWAGDAGLVELLLAQPDPPINVSCKGKGSLSGTPLELAITGIRGDGPAVAKALLMAGADPSLPKIVAALADTGDNGNTADEVSGDSEDVLSDSKNKQKPAAGSRMATPAVRSVFQDCSVMFWNSSVRAYEAYSNSSYDVALTIWGNAIDFITKGKLSISDADKARLHYNRARAMCHLQRRVDALEELDKALALSPDYINARTLQAESHFELYAFDKCLAAISALEDAGAVEGKPKLVAIRDKAREQKNLNHYQVLGIASGPKATEAEIKKAYRRQSMKWHPDKHQMNADSKARANTTFKRLNEANQVLGEAYSKMMYDAELEVRQRQAFEDQMRQKQREEENEAQRRRRSSYKQPATNGSGESDDVPRRGSQAQRYMYQQSNYSDGARRGYGRADVMSDDEDEDDLHEQYDGFKSAYRRAPSSRGDVRWPDRSKGEMLDSFDGDDVYGEEELMHDSYDGGEFDYGPGYR
eukprot:g4504.t1